MRPPPGKYPIIWHPWWPNALGLITLLLRVLVAFAYRTSGGLLTLCHLPTIPRETKDFVLQKALRENFDL